jgi:N-acetylneuraminic acid mutarotase
LGVIPAKVSLQLEDSPLTDCQDATPEEDHHSRSEVRNRDRLYAELLFWNNFDRWSETNFTRGACVSRQGELNMRTSERCLHICFPLCFQRCLRISLPLVGYLFVAVCVSQSAVAETNAAWTWVGGSNTINLPGDYGTLGKFAPTNIPPGRRDAATWTDRNGNLWLFGGAGYDPATNSTGVLLNDVWEFNPILKEWAWMGGSRAGLVRGHGVYGAIGTSAPGNVPGSRSRAVGWTDTDGNFWLFGGTGCDASGNRGQLNDLWEYRPVTDEWTWMGGSSSVGNNGGQAGVYGTLGVSTTGAIPGSRSGAVNWTDKGGNLWLFGGSGFDSKGVSGVLDDLWEFQPALNEWVWMGGNNTVPKSGGWPGVYAASGKPALGNMPGSRSGAAGWTGRDGSLWLFGGSGFDADGAFTTLNDLWKWNPTTKAWSWIGGSITSRGCSSTHQQGPLIRCGGQSGVYGTFGASAASNIPGARAGATSWTDEAGNVWLLGGQGYDAAGNVGDLNDYWRFDLSFSTWTWIGGTSVESSCKFIPAGEVFCKGQQGAYGTLGVPGPANAPGGRYGASAWKDDVGNFWLFGGYGTDHAGNGMGTLNDLWEYRGGGV